MRRGDLVRVRGESALYKVLECEDERGPMPRILVEAQLGWPINPTERVNLSDVEEE